MNTKTAIVTGGSRGIGSAACIALASIATNLVINYAGNTDSAEKTAEKCRALGANVVIVKGDVSKYADCENVVNAAIENFKTVDILVNNAGITRDNLTARMTEQEFDDVIAINLKGSYNMMKAVSRTMMKQRSGKIINVSSVVGLMGNAGQINYAASKAGVIGMTKSLARELAPRNVTVNAVAPGFIQTDMTANLPQTTVENLKSAIPAGRLGSPEDVANAIAFLSSDKADYITGQVLCIDGGMAMM